jgi:protein-S-isoprenylcysteine O-methyltransferase Ste14
MDNGFYIFLALFLVSLIVRTGYELLKEVGKVKPENNLVFAFVFASMCVLWFSWFGLCPLDPFRINVPDLVRWGGLVLFVAGLILAFGALFQLRGVENIDHLVTSGLFARLRHPMYTGFVLWILGWSIYHGAIASLAVGLMGIANILYWRRLEDARLLARYGEAYQRYRLATWF